MDCNFSEHMQRTKTTVRIEMHDITRRDFFHYPDLIISKDREIDEDVEHRIKVEWLKWRLAFKVFCD